MPSHREAAATPSTVAGFLDWLQERQSELWELRERQIGGSGQIALPNGKAIDDAGTAIVEVALYQPSAEYLTLRKFLDCVDRLCPPQLIEEFLLEWPRQRFNLVRDLLHAMKWVEVRIASAGGVQPWEQQKRLADDRHIPAHDLERHQAERAKQQVRIDCKDAASDELAKRSPPSSPTVTAAESATAGANPKPEENNSLARLLSLFTGNVADERIRQAVAIMESDGTVNEKLEGIDKALRIPATASTQELADLLGVRKQTIHASSWWQTNRTGRQDEVVERRRQRLAKHGEQFDASADE